MKPARDTHNAIAKAEARHATLTTWLDAYIVPTRQELLIKPDSPQVRHQLGVLEEGLSYGGSDNGWPPSPALAKFDFRSVGRMGGPLGGRKATLRELDDVTERIALLKALLPSPALKKEASARLTALFNSVVEETRFDALTADVIGACELVERSIRATAAEADRIRKAIEDIRALSNDFALDVTIPSAPEMDPCDVKYVVLVGTMLRNSSARALLEDLLARELDDARAARAPRPLEAVAG